MGLGFVPVVGDEVCPHAVSSRQQDKSKIRDSRKEMTRESIEL